ncbi:unnamed protein product [Microthlaspi erraticum]|uniref:Uncharacterized protein n=1 Tax=Microthlaspi erraticum TaxID=1685480 RepID=A0A6D2IEN8_9BRAS|nr:unnamed protein product [Microthlaspi erraticum]
MSSGELTDPDFDLIMPSSERRLDSILRAPTHSLAAPPSQGKKLESSPSSTPQNLHQSSPDPRWPLLNRWSTNSSHSSPSSPVQNLQNEPNLSNASLSRSLVSDSAVDPSLVVDSQGIEPVMISEEPTITLEVKASKQSQLETESSKTPIDNVTQSEISQSQVGQEAGTVIVTPQGAWKKPLHFSAFNNEARVAVNSSWPALSTTNQIRKKPFQKGSSADVTKGKMIALNILGLQRWISHYAIFIELPCLIT